jgi:hypothetical protein
VVQKNVSRSFSSIKGIAGNEFETAHVLYLPKERLGLRKKNNTLFLLKISC